LEANSTMTDFCKIVPENVEVFVKCLMPITVLYGLLALATCNKRSYLGSCS
jgi:hypothetical protein